MKQPKLNRSRRRVLVIDDELAIHMLVKARLADEGVELHTALGGLAGLDAAVALMPDVVLLDVEMPDLDGFEVCRRLKANSTTSNIQIIFLSADSSTAQKPPGSTSARSTTFPNRSSRPSCAPACGRRFEPNR